jgi:hypothetical protein
MFHLGSVKKIDSLATRAIRPARYGAGGGAPGDDPPMKTFRPSANVMSLPFALNEPSLAR